jgi:questin oxidase-like protein
MGTHEDLLAAYERLHRTGPEFGGDEEGNHGLTNHGPMAVEVMVRRGLDIRPQVWLDRYVGRLTDLPSPTERITGENWPDALGDGRRVGDWTAFFRAETRARPWRDTLAAWWPRLLPGIAAGSTHGVIRVGHAVRALQVTREAEALDELADGLAFWAARARTLPGGGSSQRRLPPDAALDALPALPDRTGLIAHRLTRLGGLPEWPSAVAALDVPADPDDVPAALGALVDAATERYLRVGPDAPVLLVHTATAPNAVLHCLPVLPKSLWRTSLTAAWTAAAAITVTYAGPRPDRPRPALPRADDPAAVLLDRAADHRDEHVLKFADTAVESYERTGSTAALAAAHLAADLLPAAH